MSNNSQQVHQEQYSLDHQQPQQNSFEAKLVNYRVAKRTLKIQVYVVDPGFDINAGKVTISAEWKKYSYERSIFVNDLIALKQKCLYELIPWIINQLSNKNDETNKCILILVLIVYKSVKSVQYMH